jgi:hypothetical protein
MPLITEFLQEGTEVREGGKSPASVLSVSSFAKLCPAEVRVEGRAGIEHVFTEDNEGNEEGERP